MPLWNTGAPRTVASPSTKRSVHHRPLGSELLWAASARSANWPLCVGRAAGAARSPGEAWKRSLTALKPTLIQNDQRLRTAWLDVTKDSHAPTAGTVADS